MLRAEAYESRSSCRLLMRKFTTHPIFFFKGGIYAFSLYRLIDESPEPAPAPEPTPEPTPEPSSKSTEEVGSVNYANTYPFDGTTFSGDGTYYGETSNGNCAIMPIPSMYSGMIPGEKLKRMPDSFSKYDRIPKFPRSRKPSHRVVGYIQLFAQVGIPLPRFLDPLSPPAWAVGRVYDLAVALNAGQYGGSEMCGACIEGEGSGNGAGSDPITGTFKVRDEGLVRDLLRCRG